MKSLLSLLLGATLGIAGTYYFTVTQPAAGVEARAKLSASAATIAQSSTVAIAQSDTAKAPAENPRQSGNSQFGGGRGNFLPEEIEGVTKDDIAKFRGAYFKTFQDEEVQAARAKMTELRKEAEYASDDQKKGMKADFEEATENMRKASKAALMKAEPALSEDAVDKIMTSVEKRMKARGQAQKKAR